MNKPTKNGLQTCLKRMCAGEQLTVSYSDFSKRVIIATVSRLNADKTIRFVPDYTTSETSALITKTL